MTSPENVCLGYLVIRIPNPKAELDAGFEFRHFFLILIEEDGLIRFQVPAKCFPDLLFTSQFESIQNAQQLRIRLAHPSINGVTNQRLSIRGRDPFFR